MIRARIPFFLAFLLALGLLPRTLTASASAYCVIHGFEAIVREGPTRGMILSGNMALQSYGDGSLKGTLLSADRQVLVNVTGHEDGHLIFLVFDLGYSGSTLAYVLGIGALQQPFSECSGAMAGFMAGPQAGDTGVWAAPIS